jgi:hypothetical protein
VLIAPLSENQLPVVYLRQNAKRKTQKEESQEK